jgi:hypothetical protein
VTVYSFASPVKSQDPYLVPEAGEEFAAADVKVCAGASGSQLGPNQLPFSVVFADGQQVPATFGEVRKPYLGNVVSLAANQCAKGYVPFEIAKAARPQSVDLAALPSYRWIIPPAG